MKFRLVAIDVDGTLLHDDHHLSRRTVAAVVALQERGVRVVLATGRGPRSCDPLIETLGLNEPVITHNGAVIYHPSEGRADLELGFKVTELKPVINFCREEAIHFDLSTAFEMYVEQIREEYLPLYQRFNMQPVLLDEIEEITAPIVKMTLTDRAERLDQLLPILRARFPEGSFIRSGEIFVDVKHPAATKANALRLLMARYELISDQVLAFGNYFNDLEMLQMAGLGVAMENAPQEVKNVADLVTYSNNADGVAHILEQLLEDKLVV